MLLAPVQTSPFPSEHAFARAFFQEALRHLTDAHVLHIHERYAAAVTSSMKAAELGVKSVLILDGAWRYSDPLFKTHTPVSDLENDRFFCRLHRSLNAQRSGLVDEIKEMESLEPTHFETSTNKKQSAKPVIEANCEYPFLMVLPPGASVYAQTELRRPEEHFTARESARYFGISRETIQSLAVIYHEAQSWEIEVPPPL